MKALIYKDLCIFKYSRKVLIFICAIYALWFFFTGSSAMLSVLMVIGAVMAVGPFQYDELSKWDIYGLSLPVTRREAVTARYLVVLLLQAAAAAIAIVLTLVYWAVFPEKSLEGAGLALEGAGVWALFFTAIALPTTYRFGSNRGRLITLLFTLVPAMFAAFLLKVDENILQSLTEVSAFQVALTFHILLAVAILAVIGSYLFSCRIYLKKDF